MTPEQIAALAEATAAALDLPIAPGHRPGVLQYLALAASHAEAVNAFAPAIEDDPAPAFTPVSPPDAP